MEPSANSASPADPADSDLVGVARDAETILDILGEFEALGYTAQFLPAESEGRSEPSDELECATCRNRAPAASLASLPLRRLEGASDPDDMLAVVALECPRCGARGTVVLHYGPLATNEEDAILQALTVSARAPHLPDLDRIRSRADGLQTGELRLGTANAAAQAEAILSDSDARVLEGATSSGADIEHRRSEDTVEPTP
jgi:hypothetical protein